MPSAYLDGLKMLGRRELSEQQVRQRLARKAYTPDEIDEAVARLREERAINDQRVAEAIARTETGVRKRGKSPRPHAARARRHREGDRQTGDRRRVRAGSTTTRCSSRRCASGCAAERRSPTIASSSGCSGISSARASSRTG